VSKNNLEIITLNKPGITNFAKARNELLKKAKSEWVLFVDSDEVVSKELYTQVLKQIESDSYNGFYIYRRNYFLGKYIGEDKIIRLGRKSSGEWQRAVHETWVIKGKVGELRNPLTHNTASSLHDYITKINNYSDVHAKENYNEGKKSSLVKIICYPVGKFVVTLFKSRNIVFSIMQSFHSFLAWSKEWTLQKS
jgi:glycosyltransferase involved in cell wall biosynthesis